MRIPTRASDAWIDAALHIDLFAGDREPGYDRLLRDVVAPARYSHECCVCRQQIKPGEFYRRMVAVDGPELLTLACCAECLEAHMLWDRGETDPLEARITLGLRQRRKHCCRRPMEYIEALATIFVVRLLICTFGAPFAESLTTEMWFAFAGLAALTLSAMLR